MCFRVNSERRCLILLVTLFATAVVKAADWGATANDLDFLEEPAARAQFQAADFTATFKEAAVQTSGGDIRLYLVKQAPALATLPGEGVGMATVTLKPCAMNQPHAHPRATEVAYLTKGKANFAFLEENPTPYKAGGRSIAQDLSAGQAFVIPQGLIHWTFNSDCKEDAQFVAFFNHRDPGTQTTLKSLFSPGVPIDVHRATTGLDDETIKGFADAVANTASPSFDQECLKRCNIPYDTVANTAYPPAPAPAPYRRR